MKPKFKGAKWTKGGIRRKLWNAQKGKCCYCGVQMEPPNKGGRKPNMATLEHLKPRSQGGGSHPDNYALACCDCNSHRGGMNISWLEFATYVDERRSLNTRGR
jgi:5-methylcytosine-specific restriction endonuclease McrA